MAKRALKRARRKKNTSNHFLGKVAYQGCNDIPTSVELIQYNVDSVQIKSLSDPTKFKSEIDSGKVNWFKVTGISDVTQVTDICRIFGLHSFDVKELISSQQLVKVVEYDDITFILMSGFYMDDDSALDNMQIAFIFGENFIVSFKEAPIPVFDDVLKSIEDSSSQLRQKGTDYLLYVLLNTVNSLNTGIIIRAEDQLAEIEDQLIMQQESVGVLHFLHMRRIDYMHMKRFMVSFREEYNNLQHNTNGLIKDESLIYFNDFEDRLRTALGSLDDFYESLMSLLDLYYNNNNLKMNEVMKRLTVVSTIFIPLTFIVGVWGMNFKFMPELEWKYGYIVAWIILIAIAVCAAWFLKKKKWF